MQIDVFHDTACPWCRIGKRHLQLALEHWDGEPVTVRYRAFFLNQAIPPQGVDFRPYMIAKGGGQIPLERFFDGPRQAGAAVGLTFNFEQIARAPNTTLSHRLIALTPEAQKDAIIDAIYTAYFEHGQDIGDFDVLLAIAAAHDLDTDIIRAQLEGDAAQDQVLAEAQWAQQHGVRGVPFFIFDGRYALSGAQPPGVILDVLQRTAAETLSSN